MRHRPAGAGLRRGTDLPLPRGRRVAKPSLQPATWGELSGRAGDTQEHPVPPSPGRDGPSHPEMGAPPPSHWPAPHLLCCSSSVDSKAPSAALCSTAW